MRSRSPPTRRNRGPQLKLTERAVEITRATHRTGYKTRARARGLREQTPSRYPPRSRTVVRVVDKTSPSCRSTPTHSPTRTSCSRACGHCWSWADPWPHPWPSHSWQPQVAADFLSASRGRSGRSSRTWESISSRRRSHPPEARPPEPPPDGRHAQSRCSRTVRQPEDRCGSAIDRTILCMITVEVAKGRMERA